MVDEDDVGRWTTATSLMASRRCPSMVESSRWWGVRDHDQVRPLRCDDGDQGDGADRVVEMGLEFQIWNRGLRDMDGWVLMGFTLLATGGHGPFRWWTRCAALPGVIWVRCQTPWIAADDEDDEMTWQINAFPFVWVGPISRSDPRRSYAGRQQVGEDGAPEVGAPMIIHCYVYGNMAGLMRGSTLKSFP
ncbi:hypothetical protein ACLOJK_035167 [Asimina triloba]